MSDKLFKILSDNSENIKELYVKVLEYIEEVQPAKLVKKTVKKKMLRSTSARLYITFGREVAKSPLRICRRVLQRLLRTLRPQPMAATSCQMSTGVNYKRLCLRKES